MKKVVKGALLSGILMFGLSACGDSAFDFVDVAGAEKSTNHPPVSNAGLDQNVLTGTVVTLNGVASYDADGDELAYQWSLLTVPPGSFSTLSNSILTSPAFTADVDGTYVAQLIVNDGSNNSISDTVTIVAATVNSVPVANAGTDRNVVSGTIVNLDGSASSDADGDRLTYQWSLLIAPIDSFATLSNLTLASPTFTADIDGAYVVQLIVNDGSNNSIADTVTIVAATVNSAPLANAGTDRNVVSGTIVNLDGSASSDADGDGLTYQWSFISKPSSSVAELDDSEVITPSFTVDYEGSYVIALVVNDGLLSSEPDNVQINLIAPSVKLYRQGSFLFDETFNEVPFPYNGGAQVSDVTLIGIPIPTTHSLETFKLLAQGQNFTIINTIATDDTSQVVPYITGISDGYELVDGAEVEFDLVSPLTRGATVSLHFSFEIQETGDTFSSSHTFRSN